MIMEGKIEWAEGIAKPEYQAGGHSMPKLWRYDDQQVIRQHAESCLGQGNKTPKNVLSDEEARL